MVANRELGIESAVYENLKSILNRHIFQNFYSYEIKSKAKQTLINYKIPLNISCLQPRKTGFRVKKTHLRIN